MVYILYIWLYTDHLKTSLDEDTKGEYIVHDPWYEKISI